MASNGKKAATAIIEEILLLVSKPAFSQTDDLSECFFDDEALQEIERLIWSYSSSPVFKEIIEELLTFAYFLDVHKSAKELSDSVVKVIESVLKRHMALRGFADPSSDT
ncbi:MAG: hypothetical protein ACFFD4_30850 [Candidatus Odinarchaeota archaeon]